MQVRFCNVKALNQTFIFTVFYGWQKWSKRIIWKFPRQKILFLRKTSHVQKFIYIKKKKRVFFFFKFNVVTWVLLHSKLLLLSYGCTPRSING